MEKMQFYALQSVLYVINQQTLVVTDRKCTKEFISVKFWNLATGGAKFEQISENPCFGTQIGSTGRQKNDFHKKSNFDVFLSSN